MAMRKVKAAPTRVIDYYFSVLSDWAYFGGERLDLIARRQRVKINYMPIRLAEIYAGTGGILLQKRSKQRQDYRVVELERYRDHLGIPITLFPKHYPTDDRLSSCVIIAAQKAKVDTGVVANAILRAIWVEDQNISDAATLTRIVDAHGVDGKRLLRMARESSAMKTLDRNTREAQARGVFGSPFYLYGQEIYWGQDRLDFLERQIAASRN
jgi:2-hydroxychromene-2-carboxylate isomerase